MRRKKAKKAICLSLTALMVSGMMLASGCGETESSSETDFTYWVYTTDGVGTFYDDYTNNPGVQYINQQYWDADKHTLGTEENGTKINLKIQAPIAGAEQDNYNTMISTEQYPELLDLSAAAGTTPEQMYKDGILMEITEQVEKYMPDYVALLEENPDIKAKVTTTDKEGKTHYYYLPSISDSPGLSWDGFTYRRDWIVKYGTPSKYIWDWESDYVKEHGHPEVTPMEAAVAAGNLNGWKKNEIRSFTKTEGDDPDNDWEDNVVFPSGKTYPYTISDWEWMFEAFDKAIEDKGFSDNSNAQCITIPYQGAILTGS